VCPSRRQEHKNSTYQCGNGDSPEIFGNGVKVKHESYAWWYEEETEITKQKVGNLFDPFEFDPAHFEKSSQKEHANDATGKAKACDSDEQLP